jgi:hypothetical protein
MGILRRMRKSGGIFPEERLARRLHGIHKEIRKGSWRPSGETTYFAMQIALMIL